MAIAGNGKSIGEVRAKMNEKFSFRPNEANAFSME